MRPVHQIRDELVEAGATVLAAQEGQERAERDLQAGEAIRRRFEELGPDEQEAVRLELAVPEGASPDDVGFALLEKARTRAADGT